MSYDPIVAASPRVAVRDARASFSRPELLLLADQVTTNLRVAIDGRGTALAVWASEAYAPGVFSGPTRLWSRSRPAGGDWGPPQALPGSISPRTEPLMASNEAGRVLVAYRAEGNRSEALLGTTDGAFSDPIALPDAFPFELAMDASGNAVLLGQGAQVVRVSDSGAVSEPERFGDPDSGGWSGAVATSRAGEAVLQNTGEELRLLRRVAGRGFAKPLVLARGDGYSLGPQDVVVATDGIDRRRLGRASEGAPGRGPSRDYRARRPRRGGDPV